jgi:LacI family transcriptional regulator
MSKKVSMDDIAKKLNLSKNTISLALRGMPGISEQTRKLILDAANEMGYTYRIGDNSGKEQSRNICLIIPKSTRDSIGFFSIIQFGIEDEAKKNNFNTVIHYYDESETIFQIPMCIKEGMISGIITIGRVSQRTIFAIKSFNLPIIMIDHYFENDLTDCVLTDNISGGFSATEYLIKCGHREIGFLGRINASNSFYDRYLGYLKATNTYKLDLNNSFLIIDKSFEELINNDIELVVNEINFLERLPTAFFCCNDAEAIALYKGLNKLGILIPENISIIGFDNIELSKNVSPELTTMNVQKESMGKRAVIKLKEKMSNADGSFEKLLLSSHLVIRQSIRELVQTQQITIKSNSLES